MENGLKKRSEVMTEDTWNLADILPTDQEWEILYKRTLEKIKKYHQFQGTLADSPEQLYQCLVFEAECSLEIETLVVYAKQSLDQDTGNQKYQDFFQRAQALNFQSVECAAFMVPEIMNIREDVIKDWIDNHSGLSHYGRALELILRQRSHTLPEEMEVLLAGSMEATQSPQQIFSMFNDADLKFPAIVDSEGQKITLTHGNFMTLLRNSDRKVRREAFLGIYGMYEQYKNTVAAIFSANLKQAAFYARVRKHSSTRVSYLYDNEIPETVYDQLLNAVGEKLHLQHRYMGLRKRVLELDELHMYDLSVPLVKRLRMSYTFEEARELVLAGLQPLGEEYVGLLSQGFENRWIDIYENEAKRSGAYSWGVYGIHPYVLLNFNGTIDYVFTLAHEMGHALHSYYSDKSQPYVYAGYKIFVAEVASTCNEALLIRHLLNQTEDSMERAYLLNYFLESFRNTVFRQTMFAEFEHTVHQMQGEGESLTAKVLCDLYHTLNEKYYGEHVVVDREIEFEWERIPHFYTPFYVYQYATGFSAAIAISKKILAGDKEVLDGYFEFLKGGCSLSPIELLKLCKVDMSSPEPIHEALNLFGELLSELESILEK